MTIRPVPVRRQRKQGSAAGRVGRKTAGHAGPREKATSGAPEVLILLKSQHPHRRRTAGLYLTDSSGRRVPVTQDLRIVIRQAAAALAEGKQPMVITGEDEISTQQAADLLGVSRPTVVRLVEQGELPATVPGSVRRKLRLADVLDYRDRIKVRREQFIDESSRAYADVAEIDPQDLADILDAARRR